MKIGIPVETKTLEGRVGLVPHACELLIKENHELLVEHNAGLLSGYDDDCYRRIGATLVDRQTLFAQARLIIKVKEPQPEEVPLLRPDQLLFCFLHLAAQPLLQQQLLDIGCTAVAFETVITDGKLPILAPMSDIAGQLAIQNGANLLHQHHGGRGILLGGLGGAERGRVLVIGAGNAGGSATRLAAALGAQVTVMDIDAGRLSQWHQSAANITAEYPYPEALLEQMTRADLVVGAVLIPGLSAPKIITREMVAAMQPGSVFVDIAVDQGGCSETTRPTDYSAPTYEESGVTHFAVNNMPGAVPRTASQALSAAIIPFARRLAVADWQEKHPNLVQAINVEKGELKLRDR
jgi:alanine dehydrogenase